MKIEVKPALAGAITLKNTREYPFNDSRRIVRLSGDMPGNSAYAVSMRVLKADGEVGEVVVDGELPNGFAVSFTGSAREVEVLPLVTQALAPGAAGCIASDSFALECAAEGTAVIIRNVAAGSEIAVDLEEARDLYDLDIVVYANEEGRLTLEPAARYAAVIHVPAKVYDIEWGVTDEFGFQRMYKRFRPVDMDEVSVELWSDSAAEAASACEGFGHIIAPRKGFDEARLALEALTGGKNTLILDDLGMPSVMVRIPKFKWSDVMAGGEDKTCSAFIVDGEEVDCIYVSKFLNFVEFGRAYSLPGRDPEHMMDIDEARRACARKGRGWHLLTNAEYMALAHWAHANGTVPRGNTDYGHSNSHPHEYSMLAPQLWPTIPLERRSRTDAGPASWSHDGTDAGVFDLVGNLWDSVAGFRLMDGEVQVIPDNNSALNVDEGPDSKEWRAITIEGELVMPGSPGTLKFDSPIEGNDVEKPLVIPGGVILGEEIDHPHYTGPDKGGDYGYGFMSFRELIIKGLRPAPAILKELGIFPIGDDIGPSSIFVRNTGERTAYRGGSWYDGPRGGLWELYLRDGRDYTYPDIGFRSAYIEL